MRIAESASARFRARGRAQIREEIEQAGIVRRTSGLQVSLDLFVDDEMNDGLRHADVRRRDALVEAANAVLAIDLPNQIDGA